MHVAHPERKINAFKGFDGKPKGKRKLRRPGLKWDDIIKIYLKDRKQGLGLIYLDQDTEQGTRIHRKQEISSTPEDLLSSQEVPCSLRRLR